MRTLVLRLSIVALLAAPSLALGQVVLSEVVTSNVLGVVDADDDAPDWIELHNPGIQPFQLLGYGLSDDPDEPFRWTFPAVTIPPGDYLLVFASFKDRLDPAELHTNFRLSSGGEIVTLTAPDGSLVDSMETGELYVDDSRGRTSLGELLVFQEPTPLGPNTFEGRPGYAAQPTFSVPGGVYGQPQTISIESPTPDARIHYSLDAADPSEASPPYTAPIAPTEMVNVVRARAFEDGLWPSRITTQSYLIDPPLDLPIVSVVMDPEDLDFIYDAPRDDDRERPGHIELFESAGTAAFSVDTGVKIHGFLGSIHDQLSLRMMLRGGYGDEEIDYPIFGPDGVDSFRRIILRNAGCDWCNAQMRDPLVQALAMGEDLDDQDYRPAAAYVNGEYWGFYNIRERYDRFYFESHHDADPDAIDFLGVRIFAAEVEVIEGDTEHYDALIDFVTTNDMNDPANYAHVEAQMEMVEYANYQITQIFSANIDWPQNNRKWWRPRTQDGRWRWVIFDTDSGLGAEGRAESNSLANAGTPLFDALLTGTPFRNAFVNRYADFLNTRFRPEVTLGRARDMARGIFPEVPDHYQRWGCGGTWLSELLEIRDFLERRPAFATQHILDEFSLAGTYELTLDVQPPGSGTVELTAISIDSPFTGNYFLGVPVSMTAVAAPGWEFAGWNDGTLPQQSQIEIDPTGDLNVAALFQPVGEAVIHEINYNSAPDFDTEDWVELHNPGGADLDLSGWVLRDDDDLHAFALPSGTVLAAGGYLVIVRDTAAFQALFPGVAVVGELPFGFGSSSDEVRLFDDTGALVDIVAYQDDSPWPSEPDGNGPSLELISPVLDNALPGSWRASVAPHGTPGSQNSLAP